ncbi:hypothetical protein INT45_008630 [Circinella minor]|uniref:Uncharacterized protein n=1 Tax=Circinella minor TaxID=1195481 RepID=A0A8H7VNG2_9FUNG|nr:hypothetical protein INT45_008630 [Circinella minor]
MAPLEVIGAGLSRTECDRHPEVFEEAYKNPDKPVDWDWLYDEFTAAVDCPTTSFISRLIQYYPNAKVILTKRDADSWYKSVMNTIYPLYDVLPPNPKEYLIRNTQMVTNIFFNGALKDKEKFKNEPEVMKRQYDEYNQWIIDTIPANRLLVLDLREEITWEKICSFLEKPMPTDGEPFPFVNTTQSLLDAFPEMVKQMTDIKTRG